MCDEGKNKVVPEPKYNAIKMWKGFGYNLSTR
jgi:hypothetical protein